MTPDEARELCESWIIHLQAERKSAHTIRGYTDGLRLYIVWCEDNGRKVELERRPVEEWVAWQLQGGRTVRGTPGSNPRDPLEAATVTARLRGVRRFSAWLAEEDDGTDRIAGVRPPKLDDKVPDAVTAEQLAALQATCKSRDPTTSATRRSSA